MSFNIPQATMGGDFKGMKTLVFSHLKTKIPSIGHSDLGKKDPKPKSLSHTSHPYLDDLIDVSDIEGINDILEVNNNNNNDDSQELLDDDTIPKLDILTKGVSPTEISTEADGWMDEVFNTNIYGMINQDDSQEMMPNQIFLDKASPNNDLTPDNDISPLDFNTQTPLSDKTNVIGSLSKNSRKPSATTTIDPALRQLIIEAISSFVDYFFKHYNLRFASNGQSTRLIPRNEYLSDFLIKNYNKNYNKTDITKILNLSKTTGDQDLIDLIAYTDKLKGKNVKDITSLKILANYSNKLLTRQSDFNDERDNSITSITGVDQLSIEPRKQEFGEAKFELNKFRILFNYHDGNGFKFSEFDRSNGQKINSQTVRNLNDIKSFTVGKDTSSCFEDLQKTSMSNNFLLCNASLCLNSNSSSPSSTKKKNFDLSLGNFISSVELLCHIPFKEDSSSSILNYQSSISIYNKDRLIHQKMEPIIGFKVNPQLMNHDTYNLKIPFQSSFWGGYLTWLLNGSDDDSVNDIVISQTIMDDDAHQNQTIVTLIWTFSDGDGNHNGVEYQVFEIPQQLQTPRATRTNSNSAPIMNSKVISNVITGRSESSASSVKSHKRTRSKSFSELEQSYSYEQQQQFSMMLQQQQFVGDSQTLFTPPRFPQKLNLEFDQEQLFQSQDINSAPPTQQRFMFCPPSQPVQQYPHSLNTSPYLIQPGGFNNSVQQDFIQPPQRPMNFKSQSFSNLPNYQRNTIQQPPMRFINVPGQNNYQQQQQQQLPTPPSSLAPFSSTSSSAGSSYNSQARSLLTPPTPSTSTPLPQQQPRMKQHVFSIDKPIRASRQLSNSSTSSISSSGTIPFNSSPSSNTNLSNFKKMKGNFEQLLKIEFYQPPKN